MSRCLLAGATLALLLLPARTWSAEPADGPLAKYVAQEDASYGWTVRQRGKVGVSSYAELILTSQTWRDIPWKHQLFVIQPSTMEADSRHALLFVTGGGWKEELEEPGEQEELPGEARLLAGLAEQMKTPVAVLLHVPHQPIFGGKYEDEIIAYTFEQFLETGDPTWPLLLPMVKSAVRGMDAVQEYARQRWSSEIDTFTVTGASKRGWTTWLTGAVDPRATAIAPMVIDVLNMRTQMRHQKEAWGDVSYKIDDYSQRNLIQKIESEQGKALRAIVDPYRYRSLLTQPKLIVLGTNDHYWPLDALNLYWNDLVGPKYVLYVPNNRHGLNDYTRLIGSLNALQQHAANGSKLPRLSWKFSHREQKLLLELRSDLQPQQVNTWIATSDSRDFRESQWNSFPAKQAGTNKQAGTSYTCELELPDAGYAAMFGEAVFDGDQLPYFLSTNVRIISAADGEQ